LALIDITCEGRCVERSTASVTVSPRVAFRGGDVDQVIAPFDAVIGDRRGRVQRGPHGNERVVEQLDSALLRSRIAGTCHRAVGGDVVGHLVQALRHALHRGACEQKLRFAHLPDTRATVREIDRAGVLRHLPHRQLILGHPVLAGIRGGPGAFHLQDRKRAEAIRSSHCGSGVIDDSAL
jgi:hypothetical protein